MPRTPRVVEVGAPHHITQRGNNRQEIFPSAQDRRAYIQRLRTECSRHNLRVLGYCLMTNHVHLVAIPEGTTRSPAPSGVLIFFTPWTSTGDTGAPVISGETATTPVRSAASICG